MAASATGLLTAPYTGDRSGKRDRQQVTSQSVKRIFYLRKLLTLNQAHQRARAVADAVLMNSVHAENAQQEITGGNGLA